MGTNLRQRSDGGLDFVDDATSKVMASVGGTTYRNIKVAVVPFTGSGTEPSRRTVEGERARGDVVAIDWRGWWRLWGSHGDGRGRSERM